MSAATTDIKTPQFGSPPLVFPYLLPPIPVAAATTLKGGWLIATNSSGYAVAASADPTLKVWGVCQSDAVNTVANGVGSAGDISVQVAQGAFLFANGDSIGTADRGKLCYAADNQTVTKGDGAGQYPVVGYILGVDAVTSKVIVQVGAASMFSDSSATDNVGAFKARAVATSIAAYTKTAGVITANANGAIGAQDGVTLAVGDILLIQAGLSNVTAADAGPWAVSALGDGSNPFVLARPDWWASGTLIPQGAEISVGAEGTLFGGTDWKSFVATAAKVVGTDDPLLYPGRVVFTQQLSSGTTGAVTNIPIKSATKTGFAVARSTASSASSTVQYVLNGNPTAGATGTGSFEIMGAVAAGTINSSDASTLHITVINF